MPDLQERLQQSLTGRYRIDRELGSGGMSVVFLADDLRHGRQVALKVLRPELAAEIGPARFVREIELAARLNHPHILPVHDSGDAGGFLYYVMPFVEGESLRAKLDRTKQLPMAEALRMALEVADALSYAHGHGVVHRDIKPENILVHGGHAVVADFGIARAVSIAGDATGTTGTTFGTPAYMSPEQVMGGTAPDGRTDLYSLGCMLYEMLAGRPPFTGPTAEAVVHQQLSAQPPNIAFMRPSVPRAVWLAIERALAKTPADRFGSAADFAQALTEAGSLAVGEAPGSRGARWRQRLLTVRAAVIATGALLTIILIWKIWPPRPRVVPPVYPPATIAVLPFQNLSGEGPHAYVARGLHDDLLTQLSKVAALKVISRTSVMGYHDTSKPLKVIASELHAGSVVQGSVQVQDGRLRVNVQLVNGATDANVWAELYDRQLDDAFAIQTDLVQRIVTAVGAALSQDEAGSFTTPPTQSAEAYRLYLRGRDLEVRPDRPGDLRAAERIYERALLLDPNFSLALAALVNVRERMIWHGYDTIDR